MKPDIVIKQRGENGLFDVHCDGKYADKLTYEEMLGVVSQITMPEEKRCVMWLKTEEEHREFREEMLSSLHKQLLEFCDFE